MAPLGREAQGEDEQRGDGEGAAAAVERGCFVDDRRVIEAHGEDHHAPDDPAAPEDPSEGQRHPQRQRQPALPAAGRGIEDVAAVELARGGGG